MQAIGLPEAAYGDPARARARAADRAAARRPAPPGRTIRSLRIEARLAGGGSWRVDVDHAQRRRASAERLRLALVPKLGGLPAPASALALRALELGAAGRPSSAALGRRAGRARRRAARPRRSARPVRRRAATRSCASLDVDPDSRIPERRVTARPARSRDERAATASAAGSMPLGRSRSRAEHGRPLADRAATRSRRSARSGWSRTAGGRASRLRRHYFELVLDRRALPDRLPRPRDRRLVRPARRSSYVELHATPPSRSSTAPRCPRSSPSPPPSSATRRCALTDHDGLWGSMEFAQACHGLGVRPITGAELTVAGRSAAVALPP